MKKIVSLFFATSFIFSGIPLAYAQDVDISVPQPIGDFVNSLKGIDVDNFDESISDNFSISESVIAEKLSVSGVRELWDDANTWMQNTIGISLSQIIHAIGNFIMWALGLMAKLIKGALDELGV